MSTETENPTQNDVASTTDLDVGGSDVPAETYVTTARLGTEQWVIFAFSVSALISFWVLKNLIVVIWDRFAEPDTTIATLAAAALALGGAIVLYRKPNVHGFANDVAVEYSQVQWPTREEAWSHTAVVIVVSIVAAVVLAVYDLGWSTLTDLLYKA